MSEARGLLTAGDGGNHSFQPWPTLILKTFSKEHPHSQEGTNCSNCNKKIEGLRQAKFCHLLRLVSLVQAAFFPIQTFLELPQIFTVDAELIRRAVERIKWCVRRPYRSSSIRKRKGSPCGPYLQPVFHSVAEVRDCTTSSGCGKHHIVSHEALPTPVPSQMTSNIALATD